jgi:hypothetical protein
MIQTGAKVALTKRSVFFTKFNIRPSLTDTVTDVLLTTDGCEWGE